jgi:hypothetical protein
MNPVDKMILRNLAKEYLYQDKIEIRCHKEYQKACEANDIEKMKRYEEAVRIQIARRYQIIAIAYRFSLKEKDLIEEAKQIEQQELREKILNEKDQA